MTLSSAFLGNSGYTTSIEDFRQLVAGTFSDSRVGLHHNGDFLLSPGTGLAISYLSGMMTVPGSTSANQGNYFVWDQSGGSIPWIAANGTNPRIDALVMFVCDSQYGSASVADGPQWLIVAGTPASSPSAPSDTTIIAALPGPGGWYRMANVTVPANATGFSGGNITTVGNTGGGFSPVQPVALGNYAGHVSEGAVGSFCIPRNSMVAGTIYQFSVTGRVTGGTAGNYIFPWKMRIDTAPSTSGSVIASTNDPGSWATFSNSTWEVRGHLVCAAAGFSGSLNGYLIATIGQYTTTQPYMVNGCSTSPISANFTQDQYITISAAATTGTLTSFTTSFGWAVAHGG